MAFEVYGSIKEVPVDLRGRVAVKLHMGETGNPNHVSPRDAEDVVKRIKKNGGSPFLTDTTTLYKKDRYTVEGYLRVAKSNGFGNSDVVIADDSEYVAIDGYRVAKVIAEADSLLLLTHVTGHRTTGIGAAIKNLAMGCVVKETKRRIHAPMRPVYKSNACISCGACVRVCPLGCLSMDGRVVLNLKDCPACGRCIESCPAGAMCIAPGSLEKSFREFALSARAVMKLFRQKEVLCINVLKNVTKYCDCSDRSPVVSKDIGYLAGKDPLEIDLESARLLKKAGAGIDWPTWEKFENIAAAVMK